MRSRRSLDVGAILLLAGVAGGIVLGVLWRRAQLGRGVPSHDIYAAFYPNVIYALRSLREGHGLLWNSLQNCGQPFLPSTLVGLLYPVHAVFLLLNVDQALLLVAALHLAIGGIGTYLLCREYGCTRAAALSGAFAFEMGASSISLAVWLPTSILGVYVWLPAAMLVCERIVRAPTLGKGCALGVILTLQFLPGYPQIVFFTYQVLLLRVLWSVATRSMTRAARVLGVLGLAMGLPLFLGAAAQLPMMEFARQSIRSAALTRSEINPLGDLTWAAFRTRLASRWIGEGVGTILAVVPMAVAALAFNDAAKRRTAFFYLLIGALYLALVFRTPLLSVYLRLPMGSAFRFPTRFLWITGFALSVLVAFGADTVMRGPGGLPRQPLVLASALLLGTGSFMVLSGSGLRAAEWVCVAVLVVCTGLLWLPGGVWLARVCVPAAIAFNLAMVNSTPFLGVAREGAILYKNAATFAFLKEHLTPLDRVYQFGKPHDYSLMPKSASLFGIPSITDYEPQTSRRYAELFFMMLENTPLQSNNQFAFPGTSGPQNQSLLNLLAARYVIVDPASGERVDTLTNPRLALRWLRDGLQIFENPAALPRAFYVPRLRVVQKPDTLLRELSSAEHDPRTVALVEATPADGFIGLGPQGTGDVLLLEDRSETLIVRVRASAEGFLSLSDQYYPGWSAAVNGKETPILRANYAFRAVRVPAGESLVVFRYRPRSVWVGGLLSVSTLAVLVVYGLRQRSARRRPSR